MQQTARLFEHLVGAQHTESKEFEAKAFGGNPQSLLILPRTLLPIAGLVGRPTFRGETFKPGARPGLISSGVKLGCAWVGGSDCVGPRSVVIAGMRLRRWPTFVLAGLSALLWNFLFIPPRFTFYISKLEDFMMFGAYFVIAVVIGHLATQLHEREQAERRREERATALYRLTRALAASTSPQ